MFLFITEDEIFQVENIGEEDLEAVDAGVTSILKFDLKDYKFKEVIPTKSGEYTLQDNIREVEYEPEVPVKKEM